MAPRTTTVTTHPAPIPIAKTVAPSIVPVTTSLVPPSKTRTVGAKHRYRHPTNLNNYNKNSGRQTLLSLLFRPPQPYRQQLMATRPREDRSPGFFYIPFTSPLHYIPASATKIAPRETIIVPTVQVTTISATTIIITVTTPKRHNPRPQPSHQQKH